MMLMEGGWGNNIDKIWNIWDSQDNEASAVTPYLSKDYCVNTINKRDCAYLPLTNCSMPKLLTQKHGMDELGRLFSGDSVRFVSASENSEIYEESRHGAWSGTSVYPKKLISDFQAKIDSSFVVRRSDKFMETRGHHIQRSNGVNQPGVFNMLATQVRSDQASTLRNNV
jgi:hypothetical protein